MNITLKRLIFDKDTLKVYCENTDGERYAEFPISFNTWGNGGEHDAIDNGEYPITNEDSNALEYGHDIDDSGAYGTFWVALDRIRGRGFHGYDPNSGRSLTSGTYGCIRGNNDDGNEICEAIERSLGNDIEVIGVVQGDTSDSDFDLSIGNGYGEQ